MSFSFLGSLAGLLPGYMQGQRQAVKDNWTDLFNYNRGRQEQLSNLFTEATWQPRLDMVWNQGADSSMGASANAMRLGVMYAGLPGEMGNAWIRSMYDPMAAWLGYVNSFSGMGHQPPQMGGQFSPVPRNIG